MGQEREQMKLIDPRALGLAVTKISGTEAQCLCPFHNDHSPSSSFNMETGLFHCFACGEDANVYKLVSFLGGKAELIDADSLSRIIPHYEDGDEEWEWALHCELAIGNEYLHSRHVTDEEIRRYNIRQFDDGVVFVLTDMRGQPTGIQLRLYHGERRYIILGQKPKLWPLAELRNAKQGSIIFVEGVFGALNARRHGMNAYAVMGVASAVNAISIANGFRRKILVFDNDEAGKISAMKILSLNDGWEAYCPGAEADEMDAAFWDSLLKTRHMVHHTQFGDESEASRESLAAIQKFIHKRIRRPKRT